MTLTLTEIPLKQLHPHTGNPRHRVGDVDELAASITEQGLLEPLVVVPVVAGKKYTIIAGHRRHAAAKKAGLAAVPCLIREDLTDPAAQLEAMLVENLQRADLTPVEEAEAYEQLVAFGYTQAAIAKATGRSKRTVADRLHLAKLSESSRAKLHKGQITLATAGDLLDFAGHPDLVKSIEAEVGKDAYRWALSQATATRDRRAAAAKTLAAAVAGGETPADWPAGSRPWDLHGHSSSPYEGPVRLLDALDVDPAEHRVTCPHHVVMVDPYDRLDRACLDGANAHPAARSGRGDPETPEQAQERRDAAERAKQDAAAAEHARATWATERFSAQSKLSAPETITMLRAVACTAIDADYNAAATAAWLLGARKAKGGQLEQADAKRKLTELATAATSVARLVQIITMVTVVAPAHRTVDVWAGAAVVPRLRSLEALGYELTDFEQRIIAARPGTEAAA